MCEIKTYIGSIVMLCLVLTVSPPVLAQSSPNLTIEKSAAQSNVLPGEQINFTIEPRLNRSNKATDVVISDPLPDATTFVSVTGGGVYDSASNTVTWTFPEFNQGQKPSFEMVLQVNNPTAATEVVNTVTITGNDKDGEPIPGDDASATVDIQSAPLILMTKTPSNEFAVPGVELTFNIVFQNTGNAEATNIVLTDPLPQFLNYVDSSLGGVYDPGTRTVTWALDKLAAGTSGELLLIAEIDAAAPNGTVIENIASMTGDNFTDAAATGIVTVQSSPSLSLIKSADSPVAGPDENITYLLEFANTGNATATGVVLEDFIPEDTFFVSATGGGLFDGTRVVWNLTDLEASQTGSVSLTVIVRGSISPEDDIQIINLATLSSDNADSATAELEVPVVLQAILEMTKVSNSDFIDAGDRVYYALSYENIGTASAENVILSDRIPAGTSFISATGGGNLVDGEVIWTDPGLVPGAVGQVQLVLQLDEALAGGSNIINTASIDSDTTLPVSASSTITVNVAPSLRIRKTTETRFVQSGEEITYTIEYLNRGNAEAFDIIIGDRLPQNTTFVSASGGGVFADRRVTWTFPKLGISQRGAVTMTVLVGAVNEGDIIRNDVTLDSINAPAVSAFNEVPVRQGAVLTIRKEADVSFVTAGQEINFTISYENNGNITANNIILEDFLPTSTSFVTASNEGVYDPVEKKVVWTDSGLGAGAFGQVQLTLRVDEDTAEDTVITNSATIISDETSPVTGSDSFIVKSSPDLHLEKTADVKNADRGRQITYTLSFVNAGNANATETILEDPFPGKTSFVSASGGGVLQGNTVVWNLDDLQVGEQGSVNLTVVVDDTAIDGAVINNVATLNSDNSFAVSAVNQVIVDLLPNLSLSKTSANEFVEAGQQITFTIAYANTGNASARNIELSDTIPSGTSFVSATGGGTLVDDTVIWTDPSLDVGGEGQVQLTLKVDDDALDDAVIVNSATLTSIETPPITASDSVTVTRSPLLQLENTASVEFAAPGDEITFTLEYINVGNATATIVDLEDTVPSGTSFVSATAGGVLNNGVVTWTSAELPIGVLATAALTVRVDDTVSDGTVINNSATVDATNSYAVTDSSSVVIQLRPKLTLTKTANSDFVEAGAAATFILAIENTGSAGAINAVLEDQIPDQTTFVSATGGGVHDPVTDKVSWNFATLPVGEKTQVTLTIVIDEGLEDGSVIQNSATIDSDNTQPISASDSITVRRTPILRLEKTSNVDFIGPGETLTYQLVYTNIGNTAANSLVLEDPIPANTSYVSSSPEGVFSNGQVTWSIAELPVADIGSVSMTVLVDPTVIVDGVNALEDGTIIHNIATLDSPDAYAVTAEDEVVVRFSPSLDLSKTADRTFATPGDTITYALDFSNTGNIKATNLILEDTMPDNTTFESASDGGIENAGIVTWTLSELEVGAEGSVSVVVLVNSPLDNGTTIFNSASLTSDQTYPVGANNTIQVSSAPLLSLTKTADITYAVPGEEITYTLLVENLGNANANNGILEDTLPANTSFVSASDSGGISGNTVTWDIALIRVGEPLSRTLTVRVDSPLDNNTQIYNSATLSADSISPVSTDHLLHVQSSPLLILDKSVNKFLVTPGEQIVYTLTYGNTGNANAINTTLADGIPAHTTFVSASDGGTLSGGLVSWNVGALNTGANGNVTLTVLVDTPLDFGTWINNTAGLISDNAAPVVDVARSVVLSAPKLELKNTADKFLVEPGKQVVYSLDFSNTGNANATGVSLTSRLPSNTSFVSASGGGTETGGLVSWPINTLNAGGSGNVTLTVKVDSPLDNATLLFSLASIGSAETAFDIDGAPVVVQSEPLVTLVKTASVSVAQPDDQITYTLTYGNSGNANAANAMLTDAVPANTTFVSASGGGTESAGVVTWNTPLLLAGSESSVTMTVMVDSPLGNGTVITNTASLITDQTTAVDDTVDVTIESAPALTLEKTAGASVVQPDDLLTYTLNIANNGNANATNVVLSDSAPANTTFVSATGPYSEAGGVVTWTAAELPVGIPASVTMTVMVDPVVPDATPITNNASLTSDLHVTVNDSVTVTVDSSPVLLLTKNADHSVVKPGDLLTYTLEMANSGNANASGVVLTDTIPTYTTFVSATGGGMESGGVVTWTATELPVGTPASVTLTVWVDSPLENGTSIINNASLDSNETDPLDVIHTLYVQSAPLLSLQKTADKTVVNPGDQITYTLTLGNSGNANASNIVLTDTLSANTTFKSASNGGIEAGGVVTWTAAELPVGIPAQVTVTVMVNSPLDNGTTIYNSATIDSDETAPVSADLTLAVQSAPVLTLAKTADKTVVKPGDLLTYTLTLGNSGDANASNVVLEDTIPDNTSFQSASAGGTETDGVVTWMTPELLVGTDASVTLTVLVDSPLDNGTPIYNSATIDSDETEPVSTDHTMAVQSAPVLTLIKTADKTVVIPGEQITYTLTLGNNGNANASSVLLEDTIPDNTSFVSASAGGTETSGVVVWTTPELLVGTTGSVTLTVKVDTPLDNGTTIYNSATLDAAETEPVSASHSLPVQSAPLLALEKTADKTVVIPGEQITYTLTLGNNGNANASSVLLEDTIPDNTSFVSASAGGTESSGVVTWTTPELLVGTNGSVAMTVLVNSPLDNGTTIYNSATLESDQTAPVSANHQLAVQSTPVLTLTKIADKTVVNPGEQITYTLTLGNTGNANASSIVLEDTIPDNTSFVSASAGGTESGGVVTWTTPDLLVGTTSSVSLTVKVVTPLDNGTTIYNSATLESAETEPVSSSHSLPVQSTPVLILSKTANSRVVNPGDLVTYTLKVDNNGNANASGVILSDIIPVNTEFVSATAGGQLFEGVVTWTLGSVDAGTGGSVALTLQINKPLDNGTVIYNTATAESDQTSPVSDDHYMLVQSTPVLSLDKTADKTIVNPGELISYNITFSNSGDANANGVLLIDVLPADTTFVLATGGGSESGGIVSWPAFPLNVGASGSVTVVASVNSPLDNGTLLHNIAELSAAGAGLPVTAFANVVVQSAPELALTKTADVSFVQKGELITYSIDFANNGNTGLEDAVLTDVLPVDTSFVSASDSGQFDGSKVVWNIGYLDAGNGGTVMMTIRASDSVLDGDIITNSADLVGTNASAVSAVVSVPVLGAASLQITKTTESDYVLAGEQIEYTISFANTGNDTATGMFLEDAIPQFTSFVSASDGGVVINGVVVWYPQDLAPANESMVTLVVQADSETADGTIINNTVTLNSNETPPVSASKVVAVIDPLDGIAVLQVELTPSEEEITRGGEVVYTAAYSTLTSTNANGLRLIALLPRNVDFVFASDGGIYQTANEAQWIEWNMGVLAGNSQGQVAYGVKHIDNAQDNATIPFSATVEKVNALKGQVVHGVKQIANAQENATIPFSATVEKINALISVSAENTTPATDDVAKAVVLVHSAPGSVVEVMPVPSLDRLSLILLILLAGLLGGYRILSRPANFAEYVRK